MAEGFEGWKGDFQGFFLGLAADNSKRYFDAHRRQYEDAVKAPMMALLAELELEFGAAKLSRPNRDIRFAADKSPYKLNIYASAAGGGYVALDARGLMAAGGRYLMDPAELARYRAAAASEASGSKLALIVLELSRRGYVLNEPDLKRTPAPFPADHPRSDLLRRKRLIYWRRWEIGPWIASREALERVQQVWRDGVPLGEWFAQNVGSGG